MGNSQNTKIRNSEFPTLRISHLVGKRLLSNNVYKSICYGIYMIYYSLFIYIFIYLFIIQLIHIYIYTITYNYGYKLYIKQ